MCIKDCVIFREYVGLQNVKIAPQTAVYRTFSALLKKNIVINCVLIYNTGKEGVCIEM
jgi:hypothetical protein